MKNTEPVYMFNVIPAAPGWTVISIWPSGEGGRWFDLLPVIGWHVETVITYGRNGPHVSKYVSPLSADELPEDQVPPVVQPDGRVVTYGDQIWPSVEAWEAETGPYVHLERAEEVSGG